MVNHATTGGKSFGYAQQRRASSDLANRHSYLVMTAGSAQWKTANPMHEIDEVELENGHKAPLADSQATQVSVPREVPSGAISNDIGLSVDEGNWATSGANAPATKDSDAWMRQAASVRGRDDEADRVETSADKAIAVQHVEPSQTEEPSEKHADPAQTATPAKERKEPAQKAKPPKKQVKAVLKAAAVNMSARKFEKMWKRRNEDVGISEVGCFEASGCYAFLRYETGSKKATDFADVYVGGSPTMGASIMRHLEGNGNPDVYADVKYRQNVRVLLFPYPQEMLRVKSRQLMDVLGADVSYNARNHR